MKRGSKQSVTTISLPQPSVSERATPSRATLRVAAAHRVLAATLPNVIYQGRPSIPSSKSTPSPSPPLSRAMPARPKPERATPEKLDLKPLDDRCKSRPADSRKGGSGPSRDFVPWCR